MLVMTKGINNRISDDTNFAKRVTDGLARFARRDWGDVSEIDWVTNDEHSDHVKDGERVMASYEDEQGLNKFWIIRDEQATTVLFPSEY